MEQLFATKNYKHDTYTRKRTISHNGLYKYPFAYRTNDGGHGGYKPYTKYRHKVKAAAKALFAEIEKLSNEEISKLLDIDTEATYHHMKRQSEIVRKLIYMKPSDVGIYHEMLKKLEENAAFVLDRLNIIKGDSSEIAEMQEREDFINDANKLDIKGIRQMKKYMEGIKNIYSMNAIEG